MKILLPCLASLLLLLTGIVSPGAEPSPVPVAVPVEGFAELTQERTWVEAQPDGGPARPVAGLVWNAAIQAALDQRGAVSLPRADSPYYLDAPIVLKSGQRLIADRDTEIRLLPGTNTCMVRNEHLTGYATQPVPADSQPDTDITIEGGIWTTLATGVNRANGNQRGFSSTLHPVPGTHGVILLQNVRRVTVRHLTVRRSAAFALHLGNVREFTVEGIRLEHHGRDGVHVNGPASEGVIRDVTGDTRDDLVSLCAWDWQGYAASFGPIHHLTVEHITGVPLDQHGNDAIRLLPGVKRFPDGRTLACPIHDVVLRDIRDIREFKCYDQPDLETGRDKDFSVETGVLTDIRLQHLTFTRPGVIQIAATVTGFTVEDVALDFPRPPGFKLVEIGPMSATYRPKTDDPATWTEIFSPDRDVTVRDFALRHVTAQGTPVAETSTLVQVADQHPNADYPKTLPRGGTGKARLLERR